MPASGPQPVSVPLPDGTSVSALLQVPATPQCSYVLAHGAGAGMTHGFLAAVAEGLAERGVATLRYQFPYLERGSRRPDPPAVAHQAVRAAVHAAARHLPDVPLFAGGKSFGGRMTSQAQAEAALPHVQGLVFFGFPLHPAGKPGVTRADHLTHVQVPMLFLQGTRDDLAHLPLLEPLTQQLGTRATLQLIRDADHSFHAPARSGRKDAEVLQDMLQFAADWMVQVATARA